SYPGSISGLVQKTSMLFEDTRFFCDTMSCNLAIRLQHAGVPTRPSWQPVVPDCDGRFYHVAVDRRPHDESTRAQVLGRSIQRGSGPRDPVRRSAMGGSDRLCRHWTRIPLDCGTVEGRRLRPLL